MMKTQRTMAVALMLAMMAFAPAVRAQSSEVPAGTRFMVELRDTLEVKRIKVGKKFEARTLEPLRATDGSVIAADARLKGRVSHIDGNRVQLRFEKIDTRRGWVPIIAVVTGTVGERNLKTSEEGEIKASGGRGKGAAIGAAIGAGVGAVVGATAAGGKGAAIGAGAGAGTGAVVGAVAGGRDTVLHEGARLELVLDRPLYFRGRGY